MKRKHFIIGVVAAGLTFTAAWSGPHYARIVSSAHSFQRHFRDMRDTGGSLGPIERFVYSLVLANTAEETPEVHPEPRT